MDDLQKILEEEGISEDGLKSVKDNDIDFEMLKMFQEVDINDIFKIFKDRFRIRQLLKRLNSYEAEDTCKVQVKNDPSLGSGDKAEMRVDTPLSMESTCSSLIAHSNCPYTVDDMLAKKEIRGKPTAAQKYFASIIKDAAKSSRIWKKAPIVCEIPFHKKEHFLNLVTSVCPELKNHKQALWENLRKKLANHRKYESDKEKGKRSLVHVKSSKQLSTSCEPSLISSKFSSGDLVSVKSQTGNVLGQGLFMRRKCNIFAEVTVKKKSSNKILQNVMNFLKKLEGQNISGMLKKNS